jgi:ABC-type methionine transport system ATPase subunit
MRSSGREARPGGIAHREGSMATRTLHLGYPPSLTSQPIVYRLIRTFDLEVNIRQAQIALEQGWLEIEVTGEPDEIERATEWLTRQGITVEERS